MLMYVRADLFNAVAATDYIYFYTLFGRPHNANAGFEEWSLREAGPTTIVPDGGSTLALVGLAIAGLGLARRKLS